MENNIKGSKVFADGIEVLLKFAIEKNEWGVRELAKELNIDKAKALRLVQTMSSKELIYKTDNSKYKIGINLWRMAVGIFKNSDYLSICLPIIEDLWRLTNETLIFWKVINSQIVFIHRINSNHPIQYQVEIGSHYPIMKGAASKYLMSQMSESELKDLFEKQNTTYNKEELAKIHNQLSSTRTNGYCIAIGEVAPQTVGIATGIKNEKHETVAGISIAMPYNRYTEKLGIHYGNLLCTSVKDISF